MLGAAQRRGIDRAGRLAVTCGGAHSFIDTQRAIDDRVLGMGAQVNEAHLAASLLLRGAAGGTRCGLMLEYQKSPAPRTTHRAANVRHERQTRGPALTTRSMERLGCMALRDNTLFIFSVLLNKAVELRRIVTGKDSLPRGTNDTSVELASLHRR